VNFAVAFVVEAEFFPYVLFAALQGAFHLLSLLGFASLFFLPTASSQWVMSSRGLGHCGLLAGGDCTFVGFFFLLIFRGGAGPPFGIGFDFFPKPFFPAFERCFSSSGRSFTSQNFVRSG